MFRQEDDIEIEEYIKGGTAEVLVTKLFRHSGYTVKTFGSWKAADLDTFYAKRKTDHDCVTHHPDLIVAPKDKSKEPMLIEVKYRYWGTFDHTLRSTKRVVEQCEYWNLVTPNLKLIIVNGRYRPYFNVILAPHFKDGLCLEGVSLQSYLGDLSPEAYAESERLIDAGIFDWE